MSIIYRSGSANEITLAGRITSLDLSPGNYITLYVLVVHLYTIYLPYSYVCSSDNKLTVKVNKIGKFKCQLLVFSFCQL